MQGKDDASRLAALRRLRATPAPDRSVRGVVEFVTRDLVRAVKARGGMDGAWDELVPPGLRAGASVERLTPGGVLCVRVRDAGARYELEVWLRSGGLEALRGRCDTPLRRVKMEVGAGRPAREPAAGRDVPKKKAPVRKKRPG